VQAPSQPPPPDPATLHIVDFNIEREEWSIYNLEDGNRIRARVILVSIRTPRIPPQKGDLIAPETNVQIKVDSPLNRRGPKGSAATPEEVSDPKGHGGIEVHVLNSNEPWNEYQLVGSEIKMRVKLVLNRIFRIRDRYDNVGDPVYVVNFSIVPFIEA
jgi:hypothetical protein